MKRFVPASIIITMLSAGAPAPAFGAGTISGVVMDRTTGTIAAGDPVALIAFANGMQVAAETKTDAHGRYTLNVPDAGQHLIRVDHQKAAYFQPIPDGARTVDVDVYDVAPVVPGIATEADVLSMQTAPGTGGSAGGLRVTEDFFVRNSSEPARTQLSDHAYEFYLPESVQLQGSAAMGPGGRPVASSPVHLPGKGHYAFVFPVRPGETRFQVSYTVPYTGKEMGWTQREALPTENLVVLLPKSMRFTPGGTEWQPVPANPDAQTYVRKGVAPAIPVAFRLAGQGELPRETEAAAPNGGGGNTPGAADTSAGTVATRDSMAADTRPGGGLGPPVDSPDPLNRYKGWLLGGLGAVLAVGAVLLLRARPEDRGARSSHERLGNERRALRPALEEALLALERERALSLLGEEEYEDARAALGRVLHRALARETTPGAPQTGSQTGFQADSSVGAGPDPRHS